MISRYELKFRIRQAQKDRFMEAALPELCADPHGEQACYTVSSVYFDSRDLDFYWEKVDGESLRRKVRLRYYGVERGEQFYDRQFFLEIKHRIKDSVFKQRARVTTDGARAIIGDASELQDVTRFLVDDSAESRAVAAAVESMHAKLAFRAANVISYRREAWMGRVDERLRVTFDEAAQAFPPSECESAKTSEGLPLIPAAHSVMEIKFNERIPRWVRDIVVSQGLAPRRFSKYATGIEHLHNLTARSQCNFLAADDPRRETLAINESGDDTVVQSPADSPTPIPPLPVMDENIMSSTEVE